MNSRDLNRAVARATGEAVREIAERGFVLLTIGPVEHEPQVEANDDSAGVVWRPEFCAPALAF